jgi:hypothetical protein
METNSGVAQFLFFQDVSKLNEHYGTLMDREVLNPITSLLDTIYAMDVYIDYEISINDELNYDGGKTHAFQPPVLIGPEGGAGGNSRFEIVNEEGLATGLPVPEDELTNIGTDGAWRTWYYAQSGGAFIFEVAVESGLNLVVTDSGIKPDRTEKSKFTPAAPLAGFDYYKVRINNITSGLVITLSTTGTTSEPTGNAVVAADEVYGAGGTLYANAANPGTLTIYSITGQLIKTVNISGNYSLSLNKGLYVVQLNGKAYKIIL